MTKYMIQVRKSLFRGWQTVTPYNMTEKECKFAVSIIRNAVNRKKYRIIACTIKNGVTEQYEITKIN